MEVSEKSRMIEHLSSLTDPRILLKTRYKLVGIVVIALCGMLAGAEEWSEIVGFGYARENRFRSFLEMPNGIPSHDTFVWMFARICPDEFKKCFLICVRAAYQGYCSADRGH